MPDKGHMETEALLRALEKRIAAEYRKANREITRKVNAYMSEFKRKDKEWREKLENGDITEAEYKAWQTGQVMIGKRWEEMRHTLAQDYANTNDLAKQMAFDSMPDVYALNHNYATFEVEKGGKVDTSYTLYDRPTVERLLRDDPKLLPDPRPGSPLAQKLAKHKELRWEEQHVQSVVLQSILQGESLEQTAKRFTQLTEMNYRQSVRYARTATTGAQNAGRVDGYKRAEKLGVNMKQIWLSTLDSRTRHEHRVLDGQEVDVGEPFIMDGFKIKYPGDPAAPAHLLYNCRCTVIAKVKGVDFDVSDKTQRDDKIGDMSYEEWKNDKQKAPKPPENVPEGKAVEVKAEKPITTIEEAHNYLGSIFASVEKNVSYLDEELVTTSTNQLKKLNDKFGAITENNHGYISGSKVKAIAETTQHLHDENTNLILSSKYYVDKANILELERKMQEMFYSMPVADEYLLVATITHEYGHILENDIIRRRISPDIMEEALKLREQGEFKRANTKLRVEESKHARAIFNEILDIAREEDENFKLKESLSKYGHTNTFEAFAETFMNSQCGVPNVLGKAMNKWLKKEGY